PKAGTRRRTRCSRDAAGEGSAWAARRRPWAGAHSRRGAPSSLPAERERDGGARREVLLHHVDDRERVLWPDDVARVAGVRVRRRLEPDLRVARVARPHERAGARRAAALVAADVVAAPRAPEDGAVGAAVV